MDHPDSPSPARRWLRRLIYTIVGLFALVFCFYAVENMRGRNAWHNTVAELEAKGEKIAWKDFIPAPIPDEQNMLKAPMMEEWFVGEHNSGPDWFESYELSKESLRLYGPGPFTIAEIKVLPDNLSEFEKDGTPKIQWEHLPRDPTKKNSRNLRNALGQISINGHPSYWWALTEDKPTLNIDRRIIIRTASLPEDIDLVSSLSFTNYILHLKPNGKANTYLIVTDSDPLHGSPLLSARDYLTLSDAHLSSLESVRKAGERPWTQWAAVNATKWNSNKVTIWSEACEKLARLGLTRAEACLLQNLPDQTLREAEIALLARRFHMAKPEMLDGFFQSNDIFELHTSMVAKGILKGVWKEPHLIRLLESFASENFLKMAKQSMRHERAFLCHSVDSFTWDNFSSGLGIKREPWWKSNHGWAITLTPNGWLNKYKACMVNSYQSSFGFVDETNLRLDPKGLMAARALFEDPPPFLHPRLYDESVYILWNWRCAAHSQTTAHLGVLACALERHRLATGELPKTFDALIPNYLAKLPRQVVHDQPFHYRLETDGGCTLWSEGWDLTDDGGNISPFEGFSSRDASDWGYRLPARPKLGPK